MLANTSLVAATLTSVYTCPASGVTRTVAEVGVCNTNASTVKVRLAIVQGAGNPGASNWLEYDRVIGAAGLAGNGPLTRAIVLKPGQALWAYSDTANVAVVLTGIEE